MFAEFGSGGLLNNVGVPANIAKPNSGQTSYGCRFQNMFEAKNNFQGSSKEDPLPLAAAAAANAAIL